MSDTPTPSSGPSHIGRYAVRRRIGSGGFATVWLGYDEQLDAPVAIKVLADNWSEQHEVRSRFVEEGRYLRRVESPHVVPVYDAGSLDDGRPYLVMAYADQGTLTDRINAGGVSVPEALEVVAQVGTGLQALHDRGVLHRDVKPANVLFRTVDPAAGPAGVRAMVGDLGLGKALDVSSRLTMIAGTPAYVAPEQAQGEKPDACADQFSLGVLTYQLLLGRLPWQHASLAAAATPTEPAPMSSADLPVPDAVEAVVRRVLAHTPADRWPSVTAYVEALGAAVEGWQDGAAPLGTRALPVDPHLTQPGARPSPAAAAGPTPPTRPAPPAGPDAGSHPGPRRRRAAVAALAVAGLLAGGLGGYAAHRALTSEPTPSAEVEVMDVDGTLSVVVPRAWDAAVGRDGWQPANAGDGQRSPAVSAGTEPDWAGDQRAHGVFLGLLPGEDLPPALPRHPECGGGGTDDRDETDGDPSLTAVFTDCPGGVTVERLVQVTGAQLLWVQVRSADRATANRVLDSVDVYGL
ncbi:serine/threonine-protein kinase [Nocardioides litoris]|uniref:serine/threonine-protein kinase n=1 Tax=Nocardioides litoris TaxID=1926648 RepID=UPI001476DA1A|nr:serine/threonine-protein kinase [Nocardioides litoris]